MSADLVSLLFLVLLALVTQVSFGTPDPAREFIRQVGHCLSPSADKLDQCDEGVRDEVASSLNRFIAATGDGDAAPNSRVFSLCARQSKSGSLAKYVNQFQEPCKGELRVELDFGQRIIRLPDTFKSGKSKIEDGTPEGDFVDHVTNVVALLIRSQKEDEDSGRQFGGRRALANTFLDLVIVEGHSDHMVKRNKRPAPRRDDGSSRPLDDNVKLGMSRARFIVDKLTTTYESGNVPRINGDGSDVDFLAASLGCHRPMKPIGPLGDENSESESPRHDRGCFRADPTDEALQELDPRTYLRPAPVYGGASTRVDNPGLTDEAEINRFTAANRRIELRVLFRIGDGQR